jgi:precorrin-8X/cobalt-precorrin-8 methylmutase
VDTTGLPPLTRAVVERVVHTTADTTWTGDIVADESALAAGRAALLAGAPLVVDVRMVAAGITSRPAIVALDLATDDLTARRPTREAHGATGQDAAAGDESAAERTTRGPGGVAAGDESAAEGTTRGPGGVTRTAVGVRVAARRWPDGAVWVIGNAPTALAELVALASDGLVRPVLVVGMPVGFVGAVAAKAALRASGLPAVSSTTERGGAAVAAATVNALLYAEDNAEDFNAEDFDA